MQDALWDWDEAAAAAGGQADGVPAMAIDGVSIDSREIGAGDLFVALTDQRDGHDFVPAAFKAGASAALVCNDYRRAEGDGALIRVTDVLAGLEALGMARRGALAGSARVLAVTGSVGKTSTKEMLRVALEKVGKTHAAQKSFNNHWGVPLTLARMARDSAYGVFEIGMNHAGEIRSLTKMVRPHVAIITTVAPVHIGHFASEAEIARAKGEILEQVEPGGIAILNRDNCHFELLRRLAEEFGVEVMTFGLAREADIRPDVLELGEAGSRVEAVLGGERVTYEIGAPGQHLVMNSLAVLGALQWLGADVEMALRGIGEFGVLAGRGARTVVDVDGRGGRALIIDESYNANPASVVAALQAMALVPRDAYPRRIVVLGDMLELGERSVELHVGLKTPIDEAGADLVFACGANMCALYHALDVKKRGLWAETATGIMETVLDMLRPGDVVMVKGSLGSRMGPIVTEIVNRYRGEGAAG